VYELLVLALLMHWPLHAYLIADIANSMIGPWEKISRGSLSALLTKSEKTALIAPADPTQVPFPTDRPSRVFAITSTGRERFYRLMMDTTSNPGTYQRHFRIKVLHLEFISLEDQLYLIDHYMTYCQIALRYQKSEALDLATDPIKQKHTSKFLLPVALDLMNLAAQRLREQIVAGAPHDDGIARSAQKEQAGENQ
jgi:DNA-binding PadR family transcriptional regulator